MCVAGDVEKILFGLPPAVTVVKDNDSILDAVRRNSLLVPEATCMTTSLSAPPPLITHTDATPQSSPSDGRPTGRRDLPKLLKCPPTSSSSLSQHQVRRAYIIHSVEWLRFRIVFELSSKNKLQLKLKKS